MKKYLTISILSLFMLAAFASFNASATKLFSCYNCTTAKLEAIIDTHVQTTKTFETMMVLDTGKAEATYVYLRPAGQYPSSPYNDIPFMYETSINSTASTALAELKVINADLARKAQLGLTMPVSSGFITAAGALEQTEDFERVLASMFNNNPNSDLNEIARRADNQLFLLGSSIGFSSKGISVAIGSTVKDSSWVVTFSDNSKITIDINFKEVSDTLTIVITADRRSAVDKKGESIPLSTKTANGYRFSGNNAVAVSYGNYMRTLGINGSVNYSSDTISCVVVAISEPYSNVVIFEFQCD